MPYLFEMLKHKLCFSIILFLISIYQSLSNDIYSKFHQNDYKIDFQRMELIDYNKSLFNFFKVKTFKYNRTLPVVNLTINTKVNMGTDLEVVVQFYKFLSNEYRMLPGSKFQINYCKALTANIVGIQLILYKCGNFTTSCQFVQGTTYSIWNFYVDESRFPPLVPNGEYKFQLDYVYNDSIIAKLAAYLKIYRPIVIPTKAKTIY